jgi:hypothetical protein
VSGNKVLPVESRHESFFVIQYLSGGFPIKYDEAIKVFFGHVAGVKEGLVVARVLRCKVLVQV